MCAPAHTHQRACARMKSRIVEMKTLVIAEKPSVAQDIVRALTPVAGKFEKHDDHFENDTLRGHVLPWATWWKLPRPKNST
jgi:DNA topoisomerase-3